MLFASADVSLHSPATASLFSDSAAVDLRARRVAAEITNNDGLERKRLLDISSVDGPNASE